MSLFRRTVAHLLAASLVFSGLAQAAPSLLIGTEEAAAAVQAAAPSPTHARLQAVLDRAELADALHERGVSQQQLRERINALSDGEARELLAQIDQAPAGAGVLGIALTLFIVLLITDILGLTKVFPFTRPVR